MSTPVPGTPVPNALSIVVEDMAAALTFYSRCGLSFPDLDAESARSAPHAEAQAGDWRIMFDTRAVMASLDPAWTPPSGGHAMALAFACATPADVDAVYDSLVGAGAPAVHAPFDAPWGQRYATVRDPDGNTVDFYCALS
ncbi:glyoxalase [Gordonia amarae]|uniref:Glyoxalase n=2 Tax=Gordonia amarae TaxID=36821 RepID=A0A857L4U3_9ACTN|nr:VOC family protein [Gordonia amarae]MCS3876604.1 putative glyoxalase superfamily protein PhnB [Gordonia amarae]QHN19494.1 glyoxalase [Gordonia amarae]QHN23970.1 glyoxalase [Gordonia amarae]QHN32879.1 glyoxalase [Gordonia amarae]QHN41598.1 glyoxalase [Gordonia amarae]